MRLVFTIVFLLLMVFFMIFAWQNQSEQVHVVLGNWDSQSLPVFLVILLSFGAGVIITSVIGIIQRDNWLLMQQLMILSLRSNPVLAISVFAMA